MSINSFFFNFATFFPGAKFFKRELRILKSAILVVPPIRGRAMLTAKLRVLAGLN